MTILFLVFSFYSTYKVDELIKQGRDGVNDIKNLKVEGQELVENTKREVGASMYDLQQHMNENMEKIGQKTEAAFKLYNQLNDLVVQIGTNVNIYKKNVKGDM